MGVKSRHRTDEFECEDTVRHGPFDIILVCSCVVITRQQIYLPHKKRQCTPSGSVDTDNSFHAWVQRDPKDVFTLK